MKIGIVTMDNSNIDVLHYFIDDNNIWLIYKYDGSVYSNSGGRPYEEWCTFL